ncbi:hypothetical protein EJ03DRAFT_354192 [Teratosphaeria nubilosa]|uniref:Uncharacterized protein n=1 Tax=Teratosphaeria nubilosa TaxID=161662 RepID=A0A6G1L0V5_9PEZI|nr:hypothetical protein EJ03DRAFT_354192 [Teratosphaeria nubilosa]
MRKASKCTTSAPTGSILTPTTFRTTSMNQIISAERFFNYSQYLILINHLVLHAKDTDYWATYTRGRNGAWATVWGNDEEDHGRDAYREYHRAFVNDSWIWDHKEADSVPLDAECDEELEDEAAADARAGALPGGLGVTAAELRGLLEKGL